MSDNKPDDLEPAADTQRSRFEVRTVLFGVLALVVLGAIYVLVFGSPTRNRQTADSPNTDPFANSPHNVQAAPAQPAKP